MATHPSMYFLLLREIACALVPLSPRVMGRSFFLEPVAQPAHWLRWAPLCWNTGHAEGHTERVESSRGCGHPTTLPLSSSLVLSTCPEGS